MGEVHGVEPRTRRLLLPALMMAGLLLSLPLIQPRHTLPLTAFYSEWTAWVLGAGLLYPLLIPRISRTLDVPTIVFLPAALAGLIVVQAFFIVPSYPQLPLLAVAYLAWCAALMLAARLLARELGATYVVSVLAGFLLVGGVLNAVAAVLQQYEWRGVLEPVIATQLGAQVYGNIGQSNHFATHMALALGALGYLHARGKLGWAAVAPLLALLLFVLTLSGTRASWLHLAALTAFGVAACHLRRDDDTRRLMIYSVALLPGFALAHGLVELPWLAPTTAHTTVLDRFVELAGAPSDRLALTQRAWSLFLAHPLTGVGWGQFAWHNFELTGEPGVPLLPGLYHHAHNLVLQLLVETGVWGGLLAVAAIVHWAWHARRHASSLNGYLIRVCVAVLLLHSMTEYPLWNAHFVGIVAIALALGDGHSKTALHTSAVRLTVATVVVLTVAIAPTMLTSYRMLETVLHTRTPDDSRKALAGAHEAMMRVRASFFLAPYVDLAYARATDFDRFFRDTRLEFQERVLRFSPTGLVAWRYAALLALAGRWPEAERYARRAALTYPGLQEPFLEEFAAARTDDPAAQQRFVIMVRALSPRGSAEDVR